MFPMFLPLRSIRYSSCTSPVTARMTRCISMSSSRDAQADWLRHVLEGKNTQQPAPLYAWTAANLPGLDEKAAAASSAATTTTAAGSLTADGPDEWRRRIFILGVGNLGRLFASSLVKLQRPDSPAPAPITLVVHRRELLERWHANPGIEITRDGRVERSCVDVDVEWWTEEKPVAGPLREPGKQAILDVFLYTCQHVSRGFDTQPLPDLACIPSRHM